MPRKPGATMKGKKGSHMSKKKLDHLRAILGPAEEQDVIEQAKRYAAGLAHNVYQAAWLAERRLTERVLAEKDDALPETRLYLCQCCGQTSRKREGHFAHAVAVIAETVRLTADGSAVSGARKDPTDDWVCQDQACYRCRPEAAYAAWRAANPPTEKG